MIGHAPPGFACPTVIADNEGGMRSSGRTPSVARSHPDRLRRLPAGTGCAGALPRFPPGPDRTRHRTRPATRLFGGRQQGSRRRGVAWHILAAGLPSTAVIAATDDTAVGLIHGLIAGGCESFPGNRRSSVSATSRKPRTPFRDWPASRCSPMHGGALAVDALRQIIRGEQPADNDDVHRLPTT